MLLYGVVKTFACILRFFLACEPEIKLMLKFDIRALKTMFQNILKITTINELHLQIFFYVTVFWG